MRYAAGNRGQLLNQSDTEKNWKGPEFPDAQWAAQRRRRLLKTKELANIALTDSKAGLPHQIASQRRNGTLWRWRRYPRLQVTRKVPPDFRDLSADQVRVIQYPLRGGWQC